MKLTVWQQFSSNHSASFMLVGQFDTVEMAETVGKELRTMIHEISTWWQEQENLEAAEDKVREDGGLTLAEKKYAVRFQIAKWGKGREGVLDWLQNPIAVDAVSVFENLVIVNQSKVNDTWAGARPFDEILKKCGASVVVCGEGLDHYIAMNLRCNAASEEIAAKIMDAATIKQIRGNTVIALGELYPTRGSISRDGTRILLKEYQFLSLIYRRIPLSQVSEEEKRLGEGKDCVDVLSSFEEELPRVLNYLKLQGCTNIEYEFVEVQFDKDKP